MKIRSVHPAAITRCLCTSLLIGWGMISLASAYSPAESEVLSFEKQRCDAVLRRDVDALDRMMADDATYVHANGLKQSKQEYLKYVAAGKVTYTSYSIDPPAIHLGADVAVTHGTFNYEIATANPARRGASIYTAVYVRVQGRWQLTAWQATTKSP